MKNTMPTRLFQGFEQGSIVSKRVYAFRVSRIRLIDAPLPFMIA